MHWIDWTIMLVPLLMVLGMAFYSGRYVRGVADFLAAGRVAGRYVMSVGDLMSGLSVITLVALCESKYQTGYGVEFWGKLFAPVGIIFSLTGFCVYRWRETKALSFGQFLEMRYNRAFRIFASTLRTISEMVTNALGPAIARQNIQQGRLIEITRNLNFKTCGVKAYSAVGTVPGSSCRQRNFYKLQLSRGRGFSLTLLLQDPYPTTYILIRQIFQLAIFLNR